MKKMIKTLLYQSWAESIAKDMDVIDGIKVNWMAYNTMTRGRSGKRKNKSIFEGSEAEMS